jgi:8-oxo-dGTP diphosphatase
MPRTAFQGFGHYAYIVILTITERDEAASESGQLGRAAGVTARWTATNSEGYESPAALAVVVVVLKVQAGELRALVVRRDDELLALPGGFVGAEESPHDTAERKLAEKAGVRRVYLEQLATFAEPGGDPRGWIPTVAYVALVPEDTEASDQAARWVPARGRHRLARDHRRILRAAIDRIEGKLWWSNVAVGALPRAFALSEARRVYEAIAQTAYDPATFARDLKATGLIEATGRPRQAGPGRPATLYRFVHFTPSWGAGRRKRIRPGP